MTQLPAAARRAVEHDFADFPHINTVNYRFPARTTNLLSQLSSVRRSADSIFA